MNDVEKVFLIGPMGAGKSTIGKQLAMALGLPFVDTDYVIEDRCGADIPWIFDVEGEQGFRDRESKVLEDICQQGSAVVATGGGIVMRPENRKLIIDSGSVVYLRATVEQQLKRTSSDKTRPLLNADDPQHVITELMSVRDPLYKEMASCIYESDSKSPKAAAHEIMRLLKERHAL